MVCLGKIQDSITRAKRAGGMAQAAKCLPRKHKALGSNDSSRFELPLLGWIRNEDPGAGM
jgi:hypothetical protein